MVKQITKCGLLCFFQISTINNMDQISGKVLVTTDWHIGLKQNSKLRLNIVIKVVKELVSYIKNNNINTMIFAGDLFHERISVNVNSLNVALKCIQTIAKYCKVYLIVGNHDSHLKNSIDINSLNIFKDTPNVKIIDKPTEVSINGNSTLFVPWLGDVSSYGKEQFDMLFGHFDLSREYLIKSYVEDNKNTISTSSSIQKKLETDDMLEGKKTAGDFVGDFIDAAKKNGVVFSGHIHGRREFIAKGRKFILIGDPYQQNLGERNYDCGFYVIDESNNYKFVPITNVPKHVELRMSKIVKDIDSFDFSCVKGNIIHKIYDLDVDILVDAKISQKINDRQPYEELLPDYEVDINNALNVDGQALNMQTNLINKSKLEYVKNYIDNIDKAVLDEQEIKADKLYSLLEEYYNATVEEK